MSGRLILKTSLTITMFLLCIASTVAGKIIYVDDDAPGNNKGSTWANAYNNLQDALADANSSSKQVQIRVAQGIYKPDHGAGITPGDRTATFQLINGVTLKGGYAGFDQPDPNARDVAAYETILSGDLNGDDDPSFSTKRDNSYHVVTSSGTDVNAILDGFTITGGITYDWPGEFLQGHGGGIYNYSGNPTVRNCTFMYNSAYMGGAMYNLSGIPILTNCTFSGNNAWFGGGVYNDTDSPAFTDCIFSNNSAWFGGAGMYNQKSNPTLENCTFSSNKVEFDGGGMYNQDSSPILTMCTFSDNLTLDGDGGGMYNVHGGPILTNCTFSGNSSFWDGGGMSNYKSSPTLTNCIFSTNFADEYGGGIENRESDPTLTKCMFTGNWANCGGGAGIVNWYSNPILSNCMFSGNTVGKSWSDAGGGMLNIAASSVVLTNCTFTGNSAPDGNALACLSRYWYHDPPSDLRLTNCILWDGDNGIWNNDNSAINITYSDVQGGWKGKGNIDADPCFVSPGYWGHEDDPNIIVEPNDPYAMWFDGDYHLLSDSPCINAGDPDYIAAPNETDLDGNPRVIGRRIDMGAYEYSGPLPAELRIIPHTINLASESNWITALLWLGKDYNVGDIDPNSVLLEGEIEPQWLRIVAEKQFAIAKFSREDVQDILTIGEIELTITGQLTDGTTFEASDIIKVVDKSIPKKPHPQVPEFYYYSGGGKIYLDIFTELIAVCFEENVTDTEKEAVIKKDPILEAIAHELYNFVPNLVLIETKAGTTDVDIIRARQRLEKLREVWFSTPVFGNYLYKYILTDELSAKFKPDVTEQQIEAFNALHNVEVIKKSPSTDRYLLRVKDPTNMNTMTTANLYYESPLTKYAHPNFIMIMPSWP